jgi:hypothetical protein
MPEKPDQPIPTNPVTASETSIAKEKAEQKTLTTIIMWCLAPAILCFVFGAVIYFNAQMRFHPDRADLNALGNFGSYLQGTTGSLWALSGVFIIFVAFLMQLRQSKELREQFKIQLQRQDAELADQRKHFEAERADQQKQIESQRQQFESQQKSIKRQDFENSLFKLMDLHIQNATLMRHTSNNANGTQTSDGRVCFLIWYNQLANLWKTRAQSFQEEERTSPRIVNEIFISFYSQKSPHLAHYFRTLYHIFKFIDECDFENKRRYTSLVRAQLSAPELLLLFYNCLGLQGEKFKPLVERFGLLEHLDVVHLLDPGHKAFYAPTAYQ